MAAVFATPGALECNLRTKVFFLWPWRRFSRDEHLKRPSWSSTWFVYGHGAQNITRQFFGRDDEAPQNREFFSSVLSLDVQASKDLSVLAVFPILILYFIFPLFSSYSLIFY
jgi:hypothetical protein